ncbi:hypothetical protein ACLOJK_035797 [Asimina triloba]
MGRCSCSAGLGRRSRERREKTANQFGGCFSSINPMDSQTHNTSLQRLHLVEKVPPLSLHLSRSLGGPPAYGKEYLEPGELILYLFVAEDRTCAGARRRCGG